MGATNEAHPSLRTTMKDLPADDDIPQINHVYAERMDGAFVSIVFSAAIPCGLVILVTAILLGVIYGNKVKSYRGWRELDYYDSQGSTVQSGLWWTINGWKKNGGELAVFIDFNPSSLTAIASLTGKIIPYLSSSIMALVAFFVARRIILISKSGRAHELPTSHQMSLLIQMLGGNSYGPLKDTVHYHIKNKKKWVSPIPHAFSALAAVTALGIIIPIVDTWFSTTVTPVKLVVIEKVANSSRSPFGRQFLADSYCFDNFSKMDDANNNWTFPCTLDYTYNPSEAHNSTTWAYTTINSNEASLAIAGASDTNLARQWYFDKDLLHSYKYLADTRMNSSRDFRANTIAIKTQCAPMTSRCFPAAYTDDPDSGNYRYLANYTFKCSRGYRGEITSNGASRATGLRTNSSVAAGIAFAPDSSLSQMIGDDVSKKEFAAFQNPLYFGAWSIGWRVMPDNDIDSDYFTDPWDSDPDILYDYNYFYAWMLNCSAEIYYSDYDWINDTIAAFWPVLAPAGIGGPISYPFASGLPISQLCIEAAASQVQKAADSIQLANMWANLFSACAIEMMAGAIDPIPTRWEQTRNNNHGATRVPIVPLFALLGFKFLYCVAVFGLALAAYHYANPAESQSVKERLTVQGLAANYFCDGPSHQQVAVKGIEQLFQVTPATTEGDAEAALAASTEPKIGLVQTEMGGWQFVKMAASKVYDTVSPIAQTQLMSEASAGVFGSDGTEAANWISLVRK